MLCLDNNLLSDYLDGNPDARQFLEDREDKPWVVSNLVLYEAFLGSLHGHIGGDVPTIRQAVTSSMDVLDVTEQTAVEAADLQRELLSRGVPADYPDALIAANAREHGAAFATAEKHYWKPEVQEVLDVAEYEPY